MFLPTSYGMTMGNDYSRSQVRNSAFGYSDYRTIVPIEAVMGVYSRLIFPRLCDFVLDQPLIAEHRRQLLTAARGSVLEIGFGTGLNLPHYPASVHKITAVDPNIGMHRAAQRRIKQTGIEVDLRVGSS